MAPTPPSPAPTPTTSPAPPPPAVTQPAPPPAVPATPPPPVPATPAPAMTDAPAATAGTPPYSQFHKGLKQIADNIAKLGEPNGKMIAFFMCTCNRSGVVIPAANGAEAAWLRTALGVTATATNVTLANITNLSPEAFRLAMRTAYPNANPSALMRRIEDDDLLDIHAAAAVVWIAITP